MKKYTFGMTIKTREGVETFTANEFDSFEEAIAAVKKGVRDRNLEFNRLEEQEQKSNS